jgi:hypothetical protein
MTAKGWKEAVEQRQGLLNDIWDEIVQAGIPSTHPDGRPMDIVECVRMMREMIVSIRHTSPQATQWPSTNRRES